MIISEKHLAGHGWDLLLFGGFAAAGCILAAWVFISSPKGRTLLVRQDGRQIAEYDMSRDSDVWLPTDGTGKIHLVIRDGSAWFLSSDCPDHICMAMGKISRAGQSIICLPNKVVAEIADTDRQDEVDIWIK